VGGNAQIKSMKKVSGTLKLDQAQFRELEAFAKFGSDLDASTKAVIDKGVRNVEILKQPQYSPLSVEKQVAMVYLGTNNLMNKVPVNKIREFEDMFLTSLEKRHPEALADFKKGGLSEDSLKKVKALAAELSSTYKA
jgi:F-type H+-transporting ATPase subunit alpha